jgi:hypothetical protein
VRHVGEEFRLVLRGQRELLGLLLELLLGQLDLPVLALDLGVLPGEEPGLLLELLVGLLQFLLLLLEELLGGLSECACCSSRALVFWSSSCWFVSSWVSDWELFRSSSVRMLASIVFRTMPMLSVSWSRKVRWTSLKRWKEAELDDGLDLPLEEDREHDDVGGAWPRPAGVDLDVVVGTSVRRMRCFSKAHCPTRPSPSLESVGEVLALAVSVAGEELQARLAVGGLVEEEDAVLRRDERRELGEDHLGDGEQVALALAEAGELGEVGLEPVLLGVLGGRVLEVADHLVHAVLERRDLARRLDGDRPERSPVVTAVATSARARIWVVRLAASRLTLSSGRSRSPRPGHAGLAAELALDPDLAGDGRDLVGEDRQRVDHRVDRVGELGDLPLGLSTSFCFRFPLATAVTTRAIPGPGPSGSPP